VPPTSLLTGDLAVLKLLQPSTSGFSMTESGEMLVFKVGNQVLLVNPALRDWIGIGAVVNVHPEDSDLYGRSSKKEAAVAALKDTRAVPVMAVPVMAVPSDGNSTLEQHAGYGLNASTPRRLSSPGIS